MDANTPEILHDDSMDLKAKEVLARREAAAAASAEGQEHTARETVGAKYIAPADHAQAIAGAPVTPAPAPTVPGIVQQKAEALEKADDGYSSILPPPTEEEMAAAGAVVTKQDDATIITAAPVEEPTPKTEEKAVVYPNDPVVILTSAAEEELGKVPDDIRQSFISDLVPSVNEYRKELIIKSGLTPAEADEAARNRIKTKAKEKAEEYYKDNPDGVILTIDKSQEPELKLSEDEMRKMQRANALKLIVVQNEELETIKVVPNKGHNTMTAIRNICGSLSQYSIPLPALGDYGTFFGAQSGVLAGMTASDDDTMLDELNKKASLLYNYFGGSTTIPKQIPDDDGKKMHDITFDEFCNRYAYDDMDMGVYAIVCASSMEVTESTYVCQNQNCKNPYSISYNQKAMLDLSEIPQEVKERIEEIEANRSSGQALTDIHNRAIMNTRVKSPLTKNIYEFYTPSIADVHGLLETCMNMIDARTAYDVVLLVYLDRIWIYDPEQEAHVEIDVRSDPRLAFDTICHIHQVDLELLFKYVSEHNYTPNFKIKTKCPHCQREATDVLSIDNVVFLHARATLTEIAQ